MNLKSDQIIKRIFDILIASIGIVIFAIPIFILMIIASISTKSAGIFIQERVGQFQKSFYLVKIRSMKNNQDENTFTAKDDVRITKFGRFIRKYKLDELPQLVNVLIGTMSVVGPRPDVKEVIITLKEHEKEFLKVKPGLISEATLQFMNEEDILASKINPVSYYLSEIWPQKVQMNLEYVTNWNFKKDLEIIFKFFKLVFKSLFH